MLGSCLLASDSSDQLTFPAFGTPSGPLSQSWAAEMFGNPHWCPFQPSKPSILKAQKPVTLSLTTISPSAFRTSTPQAPLSTSPLLGGRAGPRKVTPDL